jgi:AcrR family transcriptional regulator
MMFRCRAMSPEQKQERRRAILDAALQLFQEMSFDAIGINEVAKRAGVAKGTVYLYFTTKEELFLALQSEAFESWFDEMDARLTEIQAAHETCTIDRFVDLVECSVQDRPAMVRLIAISHAILERNIDFSTAMAFKQMLCERTFKTGSLLEACLPFLKPGAGAQLILRIYTLVIGIQTVAEPTPIVRQAIEKPGLECFRIDFSDEFSDVLKTLLNGLAYQAR